MEEHDRERMQAAIETADRLGLTPRLQRSIDLAKEEIDRLRGNLDPNPNTPPNPNSNPNPNSKRKPTQAGWLSSSS